MSKYFGFNKPFFNFNVPNIKVDVSIVPEKYKPTQHSRFQPPTRPDGYYDFDDAITTLNNDTGKLIMLIRHGARNPNEYGPNDGLNARGIAKSKAFGEIMETLNYEVIDRTYLNGYGTDVYRTKQTAAYIFNGMDSFIDPDQQIPLIEDFSAIHGGLYTGTNTSWEYISNYCNNNWGTITSKSKKLINNIFDHVKEVDDRNKRFHIMVSHDQLLAPFIYYASNQTIHPTPSNWICFLSGVLLFLYNDDTYEIVPIMGNDDTFE